jgi:hypothetical protein
MGSRQVASLLVSGCTSVTRPVFVTGLCFAAMLWVQTSPASAQGIEGVVSDQAGPVAGAQIDVIPEDGQSVLPTLSGSGGSYSVFLVPGSYSIGVTPPSGSSDGYSVQSHVTVPSRTSISLNLMLASSETTGQLSGVTNYAGNVPAAGVQVTILPGPSLSSPHSAPTREVITDSQGQWTYGPVPAGTYHIEFGVESSTGERMSEGQQYLTLDEGQGASVATTLSGPPGPGEATLTGTVTTASGHPAGRATMRFVSSSGWAAPSELSANAQGVFTAILPAGTYSVLISGNNSEPDGSESESLTASATLVAGQVTNAGYTLQLPTPFAVPPGTMAGNTERDLGYLNAERVRWGLPAGITANPIWSQACAAHDAYLATNKLLEHPEDESKPGYSPGGNWAGTHSILSEGALWTPQANPWEDAPIHLNQLWTPDLYTVGIDESRGYTCTTTWPGIGAPASPAGTVITYPGDGTTGLPPAEDAAESPFVPGKFVGIPEGTIAGRELFVYEEQPPVMGSCAGFCFARAPALVSASLTDPGGPVQIKWVDANTEGVGGYLTGAIIIPVQPLAANTTYTADVTLEANLASGLPVVTHQWSFTTGPANPSGVWPGASYGSASAANAPRPILAYLKLTPSSFKAARSGAAISRTRTGATVSYSDSEAATTEFEVLRKEPGKNRGRSCVARSHERARARSCIRLVRVYAFSHRDEDGANRFHFSGRMGRHALPVGTYELQAVARLSGGTSPTVSTSFRIVR